METSKQILNGLVETINGQLNETYILKYNYIDLYSMYKIINGFVDNGALGVRQCMNGGEMYWYLMGIITTNRTNKVGYSLHEWYNMDYKGTLISVELMEVCPDYYRFKDNNQQTYAIPFGSFDLIKNHLTNF